MTYLDRPATAPDFLLSRSSGSLRTRGSRANWPDPFEAATALRNGDAGLIVGAVPFDTANRAALTVPEVITGPLPRSGRRTEGRGYLGDSADQQ